MPVWYIPIILSIFLFCISELASLMFLRITYCALLRALNVLFLHLKMIFWYIFDSLLWLHICIHMVPSTKALHYNSNLQLILPCTLCHCPEGRTYHFTVV